MGTSSSCCQNELIVYVNGVFSCMNCGRETAYQNSLLKKECTCGSEKVYGPETKDK